MKLFTKFLFVLCTVFIAVSCRKDDEIDTEKPTITVNYDKGFPKSCEQLKRGNTYTIRARATDNVGVASYGIDIHHNFDHHTHDNQEGTCPLDPKKAPVKPLIYMQNFPANNGGKNYEIVKEITIPQDADTGDYHCQISVVDEAGWQSRTSIDFKIIE